GAAEAATTAAATRAAEATTTAAATRAAEATTAAAAEAVTTAAAAKTIGIAEPVMATEPRPAITEGIEAIFADMIPLVASPAATSSVKTHET
ncbi:MAG TPA: hypothetical protein VL094_12250, partial [Sphingomonadaceae bacterium]|nr:hypothetical protein [Sphingomonadaceae bacterium]